jgi:hypothetical protein
MTWKVGAPPENVTDTSAPPLGFASTRTAFKVGDASAGVANAHTSAATSVRGTANERSRLEERMTQAYREPRCQNLFAARRRRLLRQGTASKTVRNFLASFVRATSRFVVDYC